MSYNVGKESGGFFIGVGIEAAVAWFKDLLRLGLRPRLRLATVLSSPRLLRTHPLPKASMRLLQAMLVVLATLTVSTGARAAVPLCSEDGRSMVAPSIVKPGSGRTFESAEDCERLRALLGHSKPGENQRNPIELGDAPLRAVPVRGELPGPPHLARLDVETSAPRAPPALIDGVFRPPRHG
jgi:hypothetical protein